MDKILVDVDIAEYYYPKKTLQAAALVEDTVEVHLEDTVEVHLEDTVEVHLEDTVEVHLEGIHIVDVGPEAECTAVVEHRNQEVRL